jgi:hypothetical protein
MDRDKLAEQWFRLLADAARGSTQAREAMDAFSKVGTAGDFSQWMTQFMPGAGAAGDAPAAMEQWWEMMGVVPRARYQKLLEHSERLRAKLEEADEMVERLREMLTAGGGQNEEAARLASTWEAAMREGVKSYSEWLEAWSRAMQQPPGGGEPKKKT